MQLWNHLTYPAPLRLATLRLAEGADPRELGLDGWTVTDRSAILGQGEVCRLAATSRLLTWRAHRNAHVRATSGGTGEGDVVRLRIGPLRSSCLIVHSSVTLQRTVLVYGTLPAHVECGEEAFIIDTAADGTVTGRVIAFSRHAWWLARLGAPVARAVQRWAAGRYVEGMRPPEFL